MYIYMYIYIYINTYIYPSSLISTCRRHDNSQKSARYYMYGVALASRID